MEVKAEQKFLRISSRKVRTLANKIKSLTPALALTNLKFIQKTGSAELFKVVRQAIANANTKKIKEENLKFKNIQVGSGTTLKRWRATSRGRGAKILKRTCHIKVILET